MESKNIINLTSIKNDWYEKDQDMIRVQLYLRKVFDEEIKFADNSITITFSSSDAKFLNHHAHEKENTKFQFVFETREAIDIPCCTHAVRPFYIELTVKKKVPVKWTSLFKIPGKSTRFVERATIASNQLLGGKSTPLTKKLSDESSKEKEVVTTAANIVGPSNSARFFTKSINTQPLAEPGIGMTGLENYANNCYMNVVVQVLSNVQEMRDYFKNDVYVKDISPNNPLSSGGKVVKAFAEVIKQLWVTGRSNAFKPLVLKNMMGKQCSLFLGWQQHDAQEFFSSLLDNLHEDLNQSQHDKEAASKVDCESNVNEKPDTAWHAHLKRNESLIIKLFHGQLMSKLTCGSCHKVSFSYDPCAQISLPIPTSRQRLKVLFATRDVDALPLLINLQISTPNATLWHLTNMLQPHVKTPPHLIRLFHGISGVCKDPHAPLLLARDFSYVLANEVADEKDVVSIPVFQYLSSSETFVHCNSCYKTQKELSVSLKRCTRCMVVAYCSRECQLKHWNVHRQRCSRDLKMQTGLPFYLTARKNNLTFESLERQVKVRAYISMETMKTKERQEEANNENTELINCDCLIKAAVKMNSDDGALLVTKENFDLECVISAACLIVEWQNCSQDIQAREVPLFKVGVTPETGGDQCSLHDSLRLFMEPERLDESESWKCPKCKTLQSAKKEMAISSPPCLLLFHLKRFTYGEFGQKITKALSYPISNFDLSPFICKETLGRIDHPLLYDLCGVICHRGTMRMGHYVCMARLLNSNNQEDVGWRWFDDGTVTKIKNDKVISPDAYVLVYRLQDTTEILKLERYPVLALSSNGSAENSSNNTKRKRTDSVASRASEHVLNRYKRSSSAEFSEETMKETERSHKKSNRASLVSCSSTEEIVESVFDRPVDEVQRCIHAEGDSFKNSTESFFNTLSLASPKDEIWTGEGDCFSSIRTETHSDDDLTYLDENQLD